MAIAAMYYIENHRVEVVSTFLGKERIVLDGKIVSKKRADRPTPHVFIIGNDEYRIAQWNKAYRKRKNIFTIRKNGRLISPVNILPDKPKNLVLFVILFGLVFGFSLGILCYNLLWTVVL